MKPKTVFTPGIKYLMRALVSATLMIWLFSKIDVSQLLTAWRDVHWLKLLILVFTIHSICIVLRAVRLRTILRKHGLEPPLWWLGLNQLKGAFFRSFAPGGVAGDIYRTYTLAQKTEHTSESVSSIIVEKAFGIASMVFLSVSSLLYGIYWLDHPMYKHLVLPILFGSGIVMGPMIIFALLVRGWLKHGTQRSSRLYPLLEKISGQMTSSVFTRWTFLQVAFISLLLQMAVVIWYFAISRALGFNLSFLVLMATIPLVELLLMVPISIGGIGVRDSAFVILLVPFGLTAVEAISFSMLSFAIVTLVTASAGLAFLFDFDAKKRRSLITDTFFQRRI